MPNMSLSVMNMKDLEAVENELKTNPQMVFINMLRGGIAKPTVRQLASLYPGKLIVVEDSDGSEEDEFTRI